VTAAVPAKRVPKLNLQSNNIDRNSWVFLKVELGGLRGYSLAQVSEVRGMDPLLTYKVRAVLCCAVLCCAVLCCAVPISTSQLLIDPVCGRE
jgi:hypothetical protein